MDTMMGQFVVWRLHGVRYLCIRIDEESSFVERIRRLP